MIRLFTTFYPEGNPSRLAEYLECVRRNVACAAIDEINILAETGSPSLPESNKIRVRSADRRPTYDDFFIWIKELASPDDVSILSNTDIWFGNEIGLLTRIIGPRECVALGRWDGDTLFDRNDSQDTWAFRGRVEGVEGGFPVGVPRCDNRILFELESAGYRILNPAFSIKANHVHAGRRAEYATDTLTHFVEPPYRYLWPHNLWSFPRTFLHNIRNPRQRVQWRFDRRRASSWLPIRAVAKVGRLASSRLSKRSGIT